MLTLREMREKLNQATNKKSSSNGVYPFWSLPENKTARVRFLPDKDQSNPFFWVEKQQINLMFNGIEGIDTVDRQVKVVVPCVEMWGETCPILNEVRPWWRSTDQVYLDLASKYWKKKSYYFQGFVVEDPIEGLAENQTENPIRKFLITSQLFKNIKDALMNDELDFVPVDYEHGLDFYISKTAKGGFADYSTSKWSRRESALTQEQLGFIDQFGLGMLSDNLPRRPTPEQLAAMYEMFEASVAGKKYDPSKWAKFYKPYGFEFSDNVDRGLIENAKNIGYRDQSTMQDTPPFVVDDEPSSTPDIVVSPVTEHTGGETIKGGAAENILEMLRKRNTP